MSVSLTPGEPPALTLRHMNMLSRVAAIAVVPTLLAGLTACDSSSDPNPGRADDWREVTRAGVTFEAPSDWTDESIIGPCRQNDPCSSDPARLSAHVYFLQPLLGQRGGCCMDIPPSETKRGWRAIEAFEGVDMYVLGDTQAPVQRVVDSAQPADG
jgi:hypothetical protein